MRLAGMPPSLVDLAWRVLQVLKVVEWKWTITEILEQPAALLDAVVELESLGQKMRGQMDEQKQGKV